MNVVGDEYFERVSVLIKFRLLSAESLVDKATRQVHAPYHRAVEPSETPQ
jgi:hypothetical protein